MSADIGFMDEAERQKGKYGKIKPNYVTLFLKKKNRPLTTFSIDTEDEVGIKYTLILKGYMGKLSEEVFNNIKKFLFDKWKLNKKSIAYGLAFEEKYRILLLKKINVR